MPESPTMPSVDVQCSGPNAFSYPSSVGRNRAESTVETCWYWEGTTLTQLAVTAHEPSHVSDRNVSQRTPEVVSARLHPRAPTVWNYKHAYNVFRIAIQESGNSYLRDGALGIFGPFSLRDGLHGSWTSGRRYLASGHGGKKRRG